MERHGANTPWNSKWKRCLVNSGQAVSVTGADVHGRGGRELGCGQAWAAGLLPALEQTLKSQHTGCKSHKVVDA